MQYSSTILLSAAGLFTTVLGHGAIVTPKPRAAGDAMKAACGFQLFSQQSSDPFGNIQGELQVAKSQSDFNPASCNVWLCKGFQFADVAAADIQSWKAGQVVPFTFDVRAPHAGVANVSVVNTATNTVIGAPLLTYADFANNAHPIPANQTAFSITVPSGLESLCAKSGACVVQHFWDARSIDQTYESCVDFTVGGSGGGSGPASGAVSGSDPSGPAKASQSPPTPTTFSTSSRPTPTPVTPPAVDDDSCE